MATTRRADGERPLGGPVVAVAVLAVVLVALPVVGLLVRAPWARAGSAITDPRTLDALRVSLVVSLSAAAVSLALGFPLAWVLARGRFRFLPVLRALVILPLVLPPVVGGIALFAAFGRRGLLGGPLEAAGITLPFSTAGAVVAAAFVASPLLILALESGIRSLDPRLESAATTLGASRLRTFRTVTLPLLRPHLVTGVVLAWARALGEFGATITFAGNLQGRTQTLPLAAFERLQSDPAGAIVVSLLLAAVSLAALVVTGGRLLSR
jgi:molybdate transport system permease protein